MIRAVIDETYSEAHPHIDVAEYIYYFNVIKYNYDIHIKISKR